MIFCVKILVWHGDLRGRRSFAQERWCARVTKPIRGETLRRVCLSATDRAISLLCKADYPTLLILNSVLAIQPQASRALVATFKS